MIVLSLGLLLALLVSVYFIVKLYGSFDNAVSNRQYVDLEIKLETAAHDYIKDNNVEVNGQLKLSYDTLKEKEYIDSLNDKNGKNCSGYVLVTKVDGINNYAGFISCQDYQTRNY